MNSLFEEDFFKSTSITESGDLVKSKITFEEKFLKALEIAEKVDMLKTVGAIKNLYDKVYGKGSYKKIHVGKKAEESEAKVDINVSPDEPKELLSKEAHERYSKAKKKLARYGGTTTHYGKGIVGKVKKKIEGKDDKEEKMCGSKNKEKK